jgi:hypothetical protein
MDGFLISKAKVLQQVTLYFRYEHDWSVYLVVDNPSQLSSRQALIDTT